MDILMTTVVMMPTATTAAVAAAVAVLVCTVVEILVPKIGLNHDVCEGTHATL